MAKKSYIDQLYDVYKKERARVISNLKREYGPNYKEHDVEIMTKAELKNMLAANKLSGSTGAKALAQAEFRSLRSIDQAQKIKEAYKQLYNEDLTVKQIMEEQYDDKLWKDIDENKIDLAAQGYSSDQIAKIISMTYFGS